MFHRDPWNLIITGVGGQGNVVLSRILGTMLVRSGFVVTIGESFGAAQRGGSVMSHVRVSQTRSWSPIIPRGKADAVIALEPVEGLRMMALYGNGDTLALINTRPIHPSAVTGGEQRYPSVEEIQGMAAGLCSRPRFVPATEAALGLGSPVLGGIVLLGVFAAWTGPPLDGALFQDVAAEMLPEEKHEDNSRAFQLGASLLEDSGAKCG